MWVADRDDDKIYAYRMSDKQRIASQEFNNLSDAGNTEPSGIWSDGATMWVADDDDSKIYAYRVSNKARRAEREFNETVNPVRIRPSPTYGQMATPCG